VLSNLSTTSARETIEKQLHGAAKKEKRVETGAGKLSDLPPASKLSRWDAYVPGVFVALAYWLFQLVQALLSAVYGTYAVACMAGIYLTFRPKAIRYPGPRPKEKEFAFSEAISLDDIKTVQKAFTSSTRHITLNDVMCAVVAKALRSYFDSVGAPSDRRFVRLLHPLRLLC
jgi:hypothetical protein